MRRADAARPDQLRRIRPQVDHGAALVHVQTEPHPRIGEPELLAFGPVQDVLPEGHFRLRVRPILPIDVGELTHREIDGLALFSFFLEVLGHHFRPMDHGEVEARHCGPLLRASGAFRRRQRAASGSAPIIRRRLRPIHPPASSRVRAVVFASTPRSDYPATGRNPCRDSSERPRYLA